MKRMIAYWLCAVVLILTLAGCVGQAESADGPAIDKKLLEAFGQPGEEAVKALGLPGGTASGNGLYTAEYKWCGLPMETELGMNYGGKGVFGYVSAQGMFEDNSDTLKTAHMCFDQFTAQLGEPYAYIEIRKTKIYEKTEFDPAQLDTYFDHLANGGAGDGIQFRFSLEGKNDRVSDDGDYFDCYFLKPEDGQLRFQFVMTWVGRDLDIRGVQAYADALFTEKMEADGVKEYKIAGRDTAGRTGNMRVFCTEYSYNADEEIGLHWGYIIEVLGVDKYTVCTEGENVSHIDLTRWTDA